MTIKSLRRSLLGLTILMAPPACNTALPASTLAGDDRGAAPDPVLLVLGDIQSPLPLESAMSEGGDGKKIVDPAKFQALAPDFSRLAAPAPGQEGVGIAALIRKIDPAAILQMGDLVEYGNGLCLSVASGQGDPLLMRAGGDEWNVLNYFPDVKKIFPTIGNHETYKTITFEATADATTGQAVVKKVVPNFYSSQERFGLLRRHFPHLLTSAAFNGETGSYVAELPSYCLLSFDGAELMPSVEASATAQTLLTFMDQKLAKCRETSPRRPIIAMDHYPIFSALKEQELSAAMRATLVALFEKYRVALVLSGHEHHYLRYASTFLPTVGYNAVSPATVYMTVASFGNAHPDVHSVEIGGRFNPTDNQLDQVPLGSANRLIYFPGQHYATVKIHAGRLTINVFGQDLADPSGWRPIDRVEAGE